MNITLFILSLTAFCLQAVGGQSPPLKVSVRELLAHPKYYDRRQVSVEGYYTVGMEDSYLWPSASVAKQSRSSNETVYIDAATWDTRLHPRRSKDISDPWAMKDRYVRVIGTFRARRRERGASIPPDGPSLMNVTYFQLVR